MFTKTTIEKYFFAEKAESLVFVCIGLAGLLAAIVFFFFIKQTFYKGMAIPFLLIGLMLGVVGYTVYRRSGEDIKRNVYAFDMNPGDLKEKEIPRMKTVMKNFVIYRWVEIVLLATGLFLFFYFRHAAGKEFLRGAGLGLAFMAFLALAADYFAEQRGKEYLGGLEKFTSNLH